MAIIEFFVAILYVAQVPDDCRTVGATANGNQFENVERIIILNRNLYPTTNKG